MSTKLSGIASGGATAGATDKAVVVRSGATDQLVTPVALDTAQSWTAAQTFAAAGIILNGTTNLTTFSSLATAARAVSFLDAGGSVPIMTARGRVTAQTAAAAGIATFTVGAADATFLVAGNVLVTTSTLHTFTMTVSYTDESNTARVLTLTFSQITGTLLTAITNGTGAGAYEGVPVCIRAKAGTTITFATAPGGTYTTVTYNAEGSIIQIG